MGDIVMFGVAVGPILALLAGIGVAAVGVACLVNWALGPKRRGR